MVKVETLNVLTMVKDGKISAKDGIDMIERLNRKVRSGRKEPIIRRTLTDTDLLKWPLNGYVPRNFF